MADSTFSFTDFKEQAQYLKERGIDDITLKRLGLTIKTATWLKEQGIADFGGLSRGIVWTLRDIQGEPTGKIGARVWYAKSIVDLNKPKFLPPKGQVPGVYFTPLADWDKLEYGQRIFICESYLKADICGMLGFHAIGVSGCWGYSYQKQLNWDFQTIPWSDMGLVPTICFDSNVCKGSKLWYAARGLAAALEVQYQANPKIIVLPFGVDKNGEGADWGLDDYYVSKGREATIALLDSEGESIRSAMSDQLKIMSHEVALIDNIARCVRVEDGLLMTRSDFEAFHYADRIVWDDEGKQHPVAKAYTKWGKRVVVNELVYKPGKDRMKVPEYYNEWRPSECVPLAANTEYFESWINDCFATDVEREFILDWWSWQLQNPGEKLNTGLVIVGPPGIGKGWITAIMAKIFGPHNVASVPLSVLEKNFNAEIATKQLFIVEETDEVGGTNQTVYNKLKDMITNPILRLERKGVDAFYIDNCLNVFLTGNQIGIFKLDAADRRFMVAEAAGDMANDSAYWEPRWEWLREGGGAEAVYALLLRRDLARFKPKAMAPMTQGKKDMIETTHNSMELWVEALVQHPDDILLSGQSVVDGMVASARELMWLYCEGRLSMAEIDRNMVTKMNRALKNARVPVANDNKKIKPAGGIPTTYFQIRKLPELVPSWSAVVTDRLFWMHLKATEQGQVASKPEDSSQPTKY